MNTAKVIERIISWLDTYVAESKTNGFVVGVSGGIDSAVVSTLCAKTGRDVVLMNLPIHQPADQITRGEEHIEKLNREFNNVSVLNVDLSSLYNVFVDVYDDQIRGDAGDDTALLVLGNTRSRLRMTTLYAVAGTRNMLVCGTGNKVEDFGVGFYTKYGDGGVDLSPIADLNKSEVYELGKALDISKSIIEAQPTDGLWDDRRTDEDQIGATYPELEWAMQVWDQYSGTPPVNEFSSRQKEVFKIYKERHNANKHKMVPIPVCEISDDLR